MTTPTRWTSSSRNTLPAKHTEPPHAGSVFFCPLGPMRPAGDPGAPTVQRSAASRTRPRRGSGSPRCTPLPPGHRQAAVRRTSLGERLSATAPGPGFDGTWFDRRARPTGDSRRCRSDSGPRTCPTRPGPPVRRPVAGACCLPCAPSPSGARIPLTRSRWDGSACRRMRGFRFPGLRPPERSRRQPLTV